MAKQKRTVKVACPHCAGRGDIQGFCARCGMVAEVLSGPTPFCLACAFGQCLLCPDALSAVDAVPFGAAGFAHAACALAFGMAADRFLEASVPAIETDPANTSVGPCGPTSVSQRELSMPRASSRIIALMRKEGYIPVVEAANLTGSAANTLYDRVKKNRLKGKRYGHFHFVELASLEENFPQLKAPPQAAVAAS